MIATVLQDAELRRSTRCAAIATVLHRLALDPRPLLRAVLSMLDGQERALALSKSRLREACGTEDCASAERHTVQLQAVF